MKKLISVLFLLIAIFSFQLSNAQSNARFNIYFDINQYKIKPEYVNVLDSVVTLLNNSTNVRRIQITGYADTVGNAAANLELSNNRTDNVANYILDKGLQRFKNKIVTSSFGEKITGKEQDLEEMRRVEILILFMKPDRDTLITNGCVSAFIPANAFEGFNNNEVSFKLEFISTAAEAQKNKLVFKDDAGNPLLSNGVVRIIAMYKGKPVKLALPITVKVPSINAETGYMVYKGIEDKAKIITWKLNGEKVIPIGVEQNAKGEDCILQSFKVDETNKFFNADKPKPSCYCSNDPFGGVIMPHSNNQLARRGEQKSIVLLNGESFKKVTSATAPLEVLDNILPSDYLNFCNSFLFPGIGAVPQVAKNEREILRFIDFNVSQKNDSAEMIMNKKNKVYFMIPKANFPLNEGKKYAIIHAETKRDNFFYWTNKVVYDIPCIGLANCDHWVFEVPFTGFYSLVELTPTAKGSSTDSEESASKGSKTVKIKVKKYKDAIVVFGSKDNNETQTAEFVKNSGTNSLLDSKVSKKDKKAYKDNIFLAYKLDKGKRYAWIGKGSKLKSGFLSGNWKTPKLVYVPEEDWDSFIRSACE